MARKSRKHPNIDLPCKPSRDTVGYIRLSLRNKDFSGSIENQKLIIEEWGRQHQIPIMRYYIDNGFSGKQFNRPAFQEMLQVIQKDKIDCIVVKTFLVWGETISRWVIPSKCFFQAITSDLYQSMISLTLPMA